MPSEKKRNHGMVLNPSADDHSETKLKPFFGSITKKTYPGKYFLVHLHLPFDIFYTEGVSINVI